MSPRSPGGCRCWRTARGRCSSGASTKRTGPTWRIGRRHVEDTRSDPVVIDWRAPVAVPFYRASAKDALGLTRRRQIMVDRGSVMAVADDLFGGAGDEAGTTRLRGGDALLAELERARTGEMLDIVATIQAEQDEIIRAPLNQLLTVQGGPGTGKTAVGLHRAAFLLYNHPGLSRDGVLVLGPSRAFLRYIAQVLPALGEEAVVQTTIGDIAPKAKVRAEEPMAVRQVKGDARMGELLRRALEGRRGPWTKTSVCACGSLGRPWTASGSTTSSPPSSPAPLPTSRVGSALRSRLVSEARTAFRSSGRLGADEAWFEGELTSSDEFGALLDTLWPSVSPTTLVRDLLSSRDQLERYASGLFSPERVAAPPAEPRLDRRLHGLERRRPGPARRGGLPDRRPQPLVRAHRGGRGPGPDADAVPHDRPTRPVGLRHGAR